MHLTDLYDGNQDEADPLCHDMQSPIGEIGAQLLVRELQPAHEEDDGHGSIQNAVLGPDVTPMSSDIWKTCQGRDLANESRRAANSLGKK
jgi:hypothetical protein